MSEIINLIPQNPDVHVYHEALEIVKDRISEDFSFIIQTWNGSISTNNKHKKIPINKVKKYQLNRAIKGS